MWPNKPKSFRIIPPWKETNHIHYWDALELRNSMYVAFNECPCFWYNHPWKINTKCLQRLKGIVQPKIKILSSFTCRPKPVSLAFLCGAQRKIWRMFLSIQVRKCSRYIWLLMYEKIKIKRQFSPRPRHFSKCLLLCSTRKKVLRVSNRDVPKAEYLI